MMGVLPGQAAKHLEKKGAHIVALNCGTEMEMRGAAKVIELYRKSSTLPTMVQPNAGLPVLERGKAVYKQLPEDMAIGVPYVLQAGANIVGSCCGSTPDHTRAIRRIVSEFNRSICTDPFVTQIVFGRSPRHRLIDTMQTLHEKLYQTNDFLLGIELVSIRGSMAEKSALRARAFASQLAESSRVDWISVTDNAGGNPQLAPQALGKPILYAGKEVVIHLTCKDLNRNGLESEAWQLHSEGFHNVLAMTGDYPVTGNEGMPKPVFDIDSIGLISMLNKMNNGFDDLRNSTRNETHLFGKTEFFIGAVTTNFKLLEGEVVPQYLKLRKKIECGAQFIINQVGYDSPKIRELRLYMDRHGMPRCP